MMQSSLSKARATSILTTMIIMTQLNACSSVKSPADRSDGGVVQTDATDTSQGVAPPVVAPVVTQAVSLSWVAPVEREDGTPISMAEIAGYRLYYGTTQGDYTHSVDVADSTSMQVTLADLTAGMYYFVITAVDMDGRESSFSAEATRSM